MDDKSNTVTSVNNISEDVSEDSNIQKPRSRHVVIQKSLNGTQLNLLETIIKQRKITKKTSKKDGRLRKLLPNTNNMINIANKRMVRVCSYCPEQFYYQSNLKSHIMKSHRSQFVKKFQLSKSGVSCEICNQKFLTQQAHNFHKEKCRDPKIDLQKKSFQCMFCSALYENQAEFVYHLENVHPKEVFNSALPKKNEPDFSCPFCSMRFLTKVMFAIHIGNEHSQKSTTNQWMWGEKCEFCDEAFKNKLDLEHHVNHNHKDSIKVDETIKIPIEKFEMQRLDKNPEEQDPKQIMPMKELHENPSDSIHQLESVQPLEVVKLGEYNMSFGCSFCANTFPTKAKLANHVGNIHSQKSTDQRSGPQKYDVCGEVFQSKKFLNFHNDLCHKDPIKVEENSEVGCLEGESKEMPMKKSKLEENIQMKSQDEEDSELQVIYQNVPKRNPVDQDFVRIKSEDDENITVLVKESVFENANEASLEPLQSMDEDLDEVVETANVQTVTLFLDPWLCDKCHKRFPQESALKKHKLDAHQTVMLSLFCPYCEQTFDHHDQLTNHMKLNHDPKDMFQCNVCQFYFLTKATLEMHMKSVHSISSCPHCKAKFATEEHLSNHVETVHAVKKTIKCTRQEQLSNHVNIVHDVVKYFKCNLCHKRFETSAIRDLHVKHVHKTEINWKCSICKLLFTDQEELMKHIKFNHQTSKSWNCTLCHFIFNKIESLEDHMKIFHSVKKETVVMDPKPWKCLECKDRFILQKDLLKHMLKHDAIKCKLCLKQLETQEDLINHMEETHRYCKVCKKMIHSEVNLEAHKKKHVDQLGYIEMVFCMTCGGYQCSQSSEYTPYCSKCHLKFHEASELESHDQKIHGNEHLYQCSECTKSFSEMSQIMAHVQAEHQMDSKRNDLYQCSKCEASFSDLFQIMAHVESVHQLKENKSAL